MAKKGKKARANQPASNGSRRIDPGQLRSELERADPAERPQRLRAIADAAANLRKSGSPKDALAVASVGERATARLGLEEALAALLCGDLERADEASAPFKQASDVIGPIIDALRAQAIRPAPRGASANLKALQALCRACKPELRPAEANSARAALRKVGAATRKVLPVDDFLAALKTYGARPMRDDFLALAARPLGRRSSVRAAIAGRIAVMWPSLVLDGDLADVGLPPEIRVHVLPLAAASTIGPNPTAATMGHLAATLGPELFVPEDRGSALLLQAFAVLQTPQRATKLFDSALAAGGDVVECMRGRWLASLVLMGTPGGSPKPMERATFALADMLAKIPDARVAALALYVEHLNGVVVPARASFIRECLRRGRGLRSALGVSDATTDARLLAAEAILEGAVGSQRALSLAEQARSIAPAEPLGWIAGLTLTADVEARRRLARDGLQATGNAPLLRDWVEAKLPSEAPLPRNPTAGMLADLVRARIHEGTTNPLEGLDEHLAGLTPLAQGALEGAIVELFDSHGDREAAEAFLRQRLDRASTSAVWCSLITVAVISEMDEALHQAVSARPDIAHDAILLLLSADGKAEAQAILNACHTQIPAHALKTLKRYLGSRRPAIPEERSVDYWLDIIDDELGPDAGLDWGEGDEEGGDFDFDLDFELMARGSGLQRFLDALPAKVRTKLVRLLDRGPSIDVIHEIAALLGPSKTGQLLTAMAESADPR